MLHLSSWETNEAKNLWVIPRRMNEFKTVLAPLPTGFHWGEACSAETHSSEVIPGWVTSTPSKRQEVLWVQESRESIRIRLVGPGLITQCLAESCSHTYVNRKVEKCSKVKQESQAIHASVGAQESGWVQHIGIFQTAFGKSIL